MKTFIAFVIVIVIIGGLAYLASKQQKTENIPPIVSDTQAKIEVPVKSADLGQMNVKDEKFYDFEIKNIGTASLIIYRVFTSCDCTFAKVFIGNKESPEFNMEMHSPPEALRWQGEILPNQKAILRATYKPAVMPVFGPVERAIIFSTNDANNQQIELSIKAEVSK